MIRIIAYFYYVGNSSPVWHSHAFFFLKWDYLKTWSDLQTTFWRPSKFVLELEAI